MQRRETPRVSVRSSRSDPDGRVLRERKRDEESKRDEKVTTGVAPRRPSRSAWSVTVRQGWTHYLPSLWRFPRLHLLVPFAAEGERLFRLSRPEAAESGAYRPTLSPNDDDLGRQTLPRQDHSSASSAFTIVPLVWCKSLTSLSLSRKRHAQMFLPIPYSQSLSARRAYQRVLNHSTRRSESGIGQAYWP